MPSVELARRRGHGEADDQRVEAAVAGAGLAAGPGRGEAADRGVLEGLRVVARASARARRAAPRPPARAGRARGSRSSTRGRRRRSRFIRTRSRLTTPAKPVAAGDQAAGHRGAAAERHDREVVLDREGEHRGDLVVRRRGRTTASGASARSPARARSRSGVDLPRVRSRRVASSVQHVLGTDERRAAPSSSASRRASEGGQRRRVDGGACRRAAEGQLDQAAGRRRAGRRRRPGRPSAGGASRRSSVMCYSVTHDVTSSQRRPRARAPGRLPRRRPRLHPRRRLAAYDAHRGRPPGRASPG